MAAKAKSKAKKAAPTSKAKSSAKKSKGPEVGCVVSLHLAIKEDRDVGVKAVNKDGTLDLEIHFLEEDKRYLPLKERAESPVVRKNVAEGKEVGQWSKKGKK